MWLGRSVDLNGDSEADAFIGKQLPGPGPLGCLAIVVSCGIGLVIASTASSEHDLELFYPYVYLFFWLIVAIFYAAYACAFVALATTGSYFGCLACRLRRSVVTAACVAAMCFLGVAYWQPSGIEIPYSQSRS